MKRQFLFALATAAALSAVSMTACSSESSSSPATPEVSPTDPTQTTPTDPAQTQTDPAQNPSDPAVQQNPGDTASAVTPQPANPTDTTATPADTATSQNPGTQDTTTTAPAQTGCAEGEVPTPYDFPLNDFVDVGDVYKNIQCNEKVVFMVRHGEREPGIGSESPLTEDGVMAAQAMGAKLVGPTDFHFVHSGFVRTYQTALNIAIGRGQAQLLPDSSVLNFPNDTISKLADGWFQKDKDKRDSVMEADSITNVQIVYTKWAYDGMYQDVFYDLETRSNELIQTYLVKDYAEMPKYTVVASHDLVLMPLVVYVSNKQVDIKLHESYKWLDYLAGIAIIINDKNELRYVVVKGGETGTR